MTVDLCALLLSDPLLWSVATIDAMAAASMATCISTVCQADEVLAVLVCGTDPAGEAMDAHRGTATIDMNKRTPKRPVATRLRLRHAADFASAVLVTSVRSQSAANSVSTSPESSCVWGATMLDSKPKSCGPETE
eukprot:CAMPEP_0179066006 /NCGR_PEP_ID=MMETSP0796-20121207/28759_1 /TAXON_ID=73915 /ORGANISM="Pyrodinium bahamense, Strain pbaha01" /LENGTH=134 /DNA_ID=CAMNT_0020763007 /DNA_START=164 /DNA_END=569 /DNA_ORIENTATION=-